MDISTLLFRKLAIDDADQMAHMEQLCFTLPWSPKQCRAAFLQSSFAAFGLFGPQGLMGYISIHHFLPEMEILNLAVLSAIRRRGAARRMLNGVLQLGRKMGMQKVSLEVRESNFPAIFLYEQAGFVQRGIRKKYYPDTHENALIMIREFPAEQWSLVQKSAAISPRAGQGRNLKTDFHPGEATIPLSPYGGKGS